MVTVVYQLFIKIPFVPTPGHITDAMISLIEWKGDETIIDLGAGDGRVLEEIKKRYPGAIARGCEIVPTVWLLGVFRAFMKRSGVRLRLGSMFHEDVSHADVIILYLFPGAMEKLSQKFERELPIGTRILCHTFGLKNRVPEREIRVPRLGGDVSVFLYRW